ncbi:TolC family protein [Candidatus Riflebacteria bacterium]
MRLNTFSTFIFLSFSFSSLSAKEPQWPSFVESQLKKSRISREGEVVILQKSTAINSIRRKESIPIPLPAPATFFAYNRKIVKNWQKNKGKVFENVLNLNSFLSLMFWLNPALKSKEELYIATFKNYDQSAYLSDLFQQYHTFTRERNISIERKFPSQMVQQNHPVPGIIELKQQLIDRDIELARLSYELTLRMLIKKSSTLFSRHAYLKKSIGIISENISLLSRVIRSLKQKYVSGSFNYSLLVRAGVERSKLLDKKKIFQDKSKIIISRLNALLDRRADAKIIPSPKAMATKIPDPVKQKKLVLKGNRDLLQLRLKIEKIGGMIALMEKMNLPDTSLGLSFYQNRKQSRMPARLKKSMSFMVKPMRRWQPQSASQRSYIEELYVRRQAMQEMLKQKKRNIESDFTDHFLSFKIFKRQETLYAGELIPQARNAYRSASKAYITGKTGFMNYIDAERLLLTLRLSRVQAAFNKAVHLFELEYLYP